VKRGQPDEKPDEKPDENKDQSPDQKEQSAKEIEEPNPGEQTQEEPEQKGDTKSTREQIFEIGETFKVRKIAPEKDRVLLLKDPSARPIFIIITDGKANEAIGEGKPVDEAFSFAQKMSVEDRIKYIVVDTEQLGIVRFGLAEKLASALCADYFKIDDLKADELIDITRRNI